MAMPNKPRHLTLAAGHSPSAESRQLVARWAEVGTAHHIIASEVRIDVRTLQHHYAAELDGAEERGIARIAAALHAKAAAGDVAAQTFFLKARGRRAGWVDKAEEQPNIVVQLDLVKTVLGAVQAVRERQTDCRSCRPAGAQQIIEQLPVDGSDLI